MVLGFDFDRLRSGPFEGLSNRKAPGFAGGYLLTDLLLKPLTHSLIYASTHSP